MTERPDEEAQFAQNFASHRIASHRIASHRIAPYRVIISRGEGLLLAVPRFGGLKSAYVCRLPVR